MNAPNKKYKSTVTSLIVVGLVVLTRGLSPLAQIEFFLKALLVCIVLWDVYDEFRHKTPSPAVAVAKKKYAYLWAVGIGYVLAIIMPALFLVAFAFVAGFFSVYILGVPGDKEHITAFMTTHGAFFIMVFVILSFATFAGYMAARLTQGNAFLCGLFSQTVNIITGGQYLIQDRAQKGLPLFSLSAIIDKPALFAGAAFGVLGGGLYWYFSRSTNPKAV